MGADLVVRIADVGAVVAAPAELTLEDRAALRRMLEYSKAAWARGTRHFTPPPAWMERAERLILRVAAG